MKKYNCPIIDIIKIENTDIVTTSLGTETTPTDEEDGIWEVE